MYNNSSFDIKYRRGNADLFFSKNRLSPSLQLSISEFDFFN
jgi:hypothetical protein